jgi:UDP-N-acetyl-D-glucosamine dehydrogenase
MPFWPGPGVGGHCIAIDPSYLSWRAGQQLGYRIGFIEHANEVNNRMPSYTVARIGEALNEAGKPIKGSKVLAIGVTYKAGVNDLRESPPLAVMDKLASKGAVVSYHDPFVPSLELRGAELSSVGLDEATVREQDCVVVLTAHAGVDYRSLARWAQLVFDTRGVTSAFESPNVVRL